MAVAWAAHSDCETIQEIQHGKHRAQQVTSVPAAARTPDLFEAMRDDMNRVLERFEGGWSRWPSMFGHRNGDMPGSELCRTLARHGVKCEASWAEAANISAGAELLRQAKAYGSDLLVMGAYGRSRLSEFILGGASRHILSKAALPVLMSD